MRSSVWPVATRKHSLSFQLLSLPFSETQLSVHIDSHRTFPNQMKWTPPAGPTLRRFLVAGNIETQVPSSDGYATNTLPMRLIILPWTSAMAPRKASFLPGSSQQGYGSCAFWRWQGTVMQLSQMGLSISQPPSHSQRYAFQILNLVPILSFDILVWRPFTLYYFNWSTYNTWNVTYLFSIIDPTML